MSEQKPSCGPKYLSIKELSAACGFSVTQIRRLVSAERIPFFQPGGKGGKLLFPVNAMECCGSENSLDRDDELEKPLPGRRPSWMDE